MNQKKNLLNQNKKYITVRIDITHGFDEKINFCKKALNFTATNEFIIALINRNYDWLVGQIPTDLKK